jgi:hypothetical protein
MGETRRPISSEMPKVRAASEAVKQGPGFRVQPWQQHKEEDVGEGEHSVEFIAVVPEADRTHPRQPSATTAPEPASSSYPLSGTAWISTKGPPVDEVERLAPVHGSMQEGSRPAAPSSQAEAGGGEDGAEEEEEEEEAVTSISGACQLALLPSGHMSGHLAAAPCPPSRQGGDGDKRVTVGIMARVISSGAQEPGCELDADTDVLRLQLYNFQVCCPSLRLHMPCGHEACLFAFRQPHKAADCLMRPSPPSLPLCLRAEPGGARGLRLEERRGHGQAATCRGLAAQKVCAGHGERPRQGGKGNGGAGELHPIKPKGRL